MSSSDVIKQIDRTLRSGKSQLQSAPGVIHLDFESRSTVPFGRAKGAVTAYQYANHPTTDVLCMRYAYGDGDIIRWDPFLTGEDFPEDLAEAVRAGWIVAAHNAGFEWCLWNFLLVPRLGLPPLPIEQMDDTAARAAIMALPRSLEQACEAMKLPVQKDKEGHRLMMQMAKPRKARKGEDPSVTYWWEDEDRLLRLGRYCDQDVEAERALDKVLVPMSPLNRRDFLLVHATNMRGVQVDVDLARRAQGVMAVVEGRYCDELAELTSFMVTAPTEVAGMKTWMANVHGIEVDSLDKTSVIRLMEQYPDPDSTVNRVLHIRQEAGKSSVAKLQRFLELTHHDGRMRENFLFHGAGPGRLSGKGAQLQNLPSRTGLAWQQAEMVINIILTYESEAAADTIELLFGHVPEAISSCLRAHLQARRERKMYVADFSNIEGRVAAWFGAEHWKIQAFRDYDAGVGPDLYKVTAGMITGKRLDQVTKSERNIMGKVPELACLAPETEVLTRRGYLAITEVLSSDELWDGREWVRHAGVVHKGLRKTINLDGVNLTGDHLVICGSSWREAKQLASSENTLTQALATASVGLPLPGKPCETRQDTATFGSSAIAALSRILSIFPTSERERVRGVTPVRRKRRALIERCTGATRTLCRTTRIVDVFSTVSRPLSGVVIERGANSGRTTEQGASKSARNGVTTSGLFSAISRRYLAGTTLISTWTARITGGTTSPETYVSSLAPETKPIKLTPLSYTPESGSLRNVYDIAHAGPRNRFTIKTDSGHLVVHNCGFGGGVGAFVSMGNNYNVKMADYWEIIQAALDDRFIEKAYDHWDLFGSRSGSQQEEWLASEAVKIAWRDRHPGIVQCWADAEKCAIKALKHPGKWFKFADGKLAFASKVIGGVNFLIGRMPNGRRIYKAHAKLKTVQKFGRERSQIHYWGVDSITRNWVPMTTYGGDLFQSFVQGTAYDLMMCGWESVERDGFEVILSVHDELGAEGDPGRPVEHFEALMSELPDWAEGCPVTAAGYIADRYRKD